MDFGTGLWTDWMVELLVRFSMVVVVTKLVWRVVQHFVQTKQQPTRLSDEANSKCIKMEFYY